MIQLTFIGMKYPCSSCAIIQNLNLEIIEKVRSKRPEIEYKQIILLNPKELYQIEGIEVEKMPIILLNQEQVSAGNLISSKQLVQWIDTFQELD